MTAIVLPTSPGPEKQAWAQMDFGGFLTPALGGPVQRINRLGNRWMVKVQMPVMEAAEALQWIAALNRGLRYGVEWRFRQPGIVVGSPGTVLVNGASQAGDSLIVDGVTGGYGWQPGQFISVLTASQRYLYQIAGTATGSGTLAINPPLREEPADNDPVEVIAPVITGWLDSADQAGWTTDTAELFGLSFSISEAA